MLYTCVSSTVTEIWYKLIIFYQVVFLFFLRKTELKYFDWMKYQKIDQIKNIPMFSLAIYMHEVGA